MRYFYKGFSYKVYMKLSIIIPAYNEKDNILKIIKKIKEVNLGKIKKELIIVDDNSTDGTKKILNNIKDDEIKIFYNEKNKGKGFSVKKGIENSTGEIIIIQDADLEYDPEDYPELIKPIINKESKIVYGSRLKGKSKRGKFMFFLGGIGVTIFTNILFFKNLTDAYTCYKVFSNELKPLLISAIGNRFDWEPEITAKIFRKKYKIIEIPISYYPRLEGKKIKPKDGFIALKTLIKWRFKKF